MTEVRLHVAGYPDSDAEERTDLAARVEIDGDTLTLGNASDAEQRWLVDRSTDEIRVLALGAVGSSLFAAAAQAVPAGEGIDNARATIRVEWPTPASDYDMKVYRPGGSEPIATSGQGTTNFEQVVLADPAPGEYVVRVINYAAAESWSGSVTFEGPGAYEPARTETWTLFCEDADGTIRGARQVGVTRGERRALDLRSSCARRD